MKDLRSFFCVLLLFVFYLLLSGTSAAQNQYYISPTGNDNNNGLTPATAWATFAKANSTIVVGAGGSNCGTGTFATTNVGACVHVAPGTYNQSITTNKAGTVAARIRYISDTQFGARIVTVGGSQFWQVQGTYTDIVGFEFDGTGNTAVKSGMTVYTQDVLVQGNKFHHIGEACNTRDNAVLASFYDTQAGHGNRYLGNTFYHNNCGAGHINGFGNGQTAIGLDSYDVAQNNLVVDHGSGYAVQVSHGFPINGQYTCFGGVFTNNTVINADQGVVVGYCDNVINDYTVTNNIVANIAGGAQPAIRVHNSSGCGTNMLYANNLLYGSTGYLFDTSGCPNTATGTQSGSNSTTFANYTGTFTGDHRLKPNSPAINSGTSSCAPGVSNCVPVRDLEGNQRPQGPAADIGSYEFLATDTPAPPTDLAASVN